MKEIHTAPNGVGRRPRRLTRNRRGREGCRGSARICGHLGVVDGVESICQELRSTRAEFWEFTDRGENFYYLEPALQPYAEPFFGWFQNLTSLADKLESASRSLELP